jgi:catechol 2,3-dioxygenase-like lactoylglutathione lyase family enzyme
MSKKLLIFPCSYNGLITAYRWSRYPFFRPKFASMYTFPIDSMSPQLLVADLEKSIAFYTEALGFSLKFRYEDFYAGLVKDGFSLHLKLGRPVKRASDDLDLTFSVKDIEGVYAALSQSNIIQPLREMPYGKEFYLADPDGHVLAFLQEEAI